ncbi:MAG: hypothetical protein PWP04_609 [Candidatus Atribacteria bacterium]|nr:hypothetical protein [Candidatus Atribacteria bacterium]
MKSKTKDWVFQGLLIALGVVLTRFASIRINIGGVEGIRIGLGTLPILIAGFMFGPLPGTLVGALTDIIGYLLSPMGGPYFPHFTLTTALRGTIAGLFAYSRRPLSPKTKILSAILIAEIGVGLFLTPYFLHTIFGIPWKILLLPRLVATPIQIAIYTYTILLLNHTPLFTISLANYQEKNLS